MATDDRCGMGPAMLALFGGSVAVGVALTPALGLARTLVHAVWHPDCRH